MCEAQAAIEWTRGELGAASSGVSSRIAARGRRTNRLYVHSEASNPANWRYVTNAADAARSIMATSALHVTFCGHIHRPALYSMSATAKMTSFTPTRRRPRAIAARAALARRSRLGRATPRRQSGGLVSRCSIPDSRGSHLLSRALRRRTAAARIRENGPAAVAGRSALRWEGERGQAAAAARRDHRRLPGSTTASTAAAWRRCGACRARTSAVPLLMKMPKIVAEGEDPAAIVSFEMEQMILPRLSGASRSAFVAAGDFARAALHRHGTHPRARRSTAGLAICRCRMRRRQRHRREDRGGAGRSASATCHSSRHQAEQRHVSADGRSRADRFWPVASRPPTRPAAGGVSSALRHRALYGARAAARRPRRSAQRSVCTGRAAVFLFDRRAAVRRERNDAGDAAAAVARSGSAATSSCRTIRPGCRKSCCVASRSSRPGATPPRRNWRSN